MRVSSAAIKKFVNLYLQSAAKKISPKVVCYFLRNGLQF